MAHEISSWSQYCPEGHAKGKHNIKDDGRVAEEGNSGAILHHKTYGVLMDKAV